MDTTRSQTKTAHINRMPSEIFYHIIKNFPFKNKFRFKLVCKKWNTLLISDILPRQDKLSIETTYLPACRCIDPDHQFDFRGYRSIPFDSVATNENLKRFLEKEVTGLKVLKYIVERDGNQVIKSCLSEASSLSLQCLVINRLEEPLVKVLPNLQHFFTRTINIDSLASVFEYCPVLTHLSIDTAQSKEDFVDILINLPKGLQYLKLQGKASESQAVFFSPAMQTLESLVLENWDYPTSFPMPDARVKAAPRLQRFFNLCFHEQGTRSKNDC